MTPEYPSLFGLEDVELAELIVFPNRVQPDQTQCPFCERIVELFQCPCPHCGRG